MVHSQIVSVPIPFYGLRDLIAGKTPTYSGWNNNPTDGADITDGDSSSVCTTGDKILGAGYQYCYMIWDLGGVKNIMCGGHLGAAFTASTALIYIFAYLNGAWSQVYPQSFESGVTGTTRPSVSSVFPAEQVRLGLTLKAAGTINPKIHQFNVWEVA